MCSCKNPKCENHTTTANTYCSDSCKVENEARKMKMVFG